MNSYSTQVPRVARLAGLGLVQWRVSAPSPSVFTAQEFGDRGERVIQTKAIVVVELKPTRQAVEPVNTAQPLSIVLAALGTGLEKPDRINVHFPAGLQQQFSIQELQLLTNTAEAQSTHDTLASADERLRKRFEPLMFCQANHHLAEFAVRLQRWHHSHHLLQRWVRGQAGIGFQ